MTLTYAQIRAGMKDTRRPSEIELYPDDTPEMRAKRWDDLLAVVRTHGGWIVSHRGASPVYIACREGSDLPEQFERGGYNVQHWQDGSMILPNALIEAFDHEGNLLTTESTAVCRTVVHAAHVKVRNFSIRL